MSSRVGLLGGTFDPPHLGHLVVAEVARVTLHLDHVRFVVAGDPWMKRTSSSADVRVRLAQAAVADDPHLCVDDREVRRSGPTYTADTLDELSAEEPDTRWWFILGTDAANGLPHWERAAAALKSATFVVASRPGYDDDLPAELAAEVVPLEVPLIDVSSSQLRDRFRRGAATRYLVPNAVEDMVVALGLYAEPHD